jgi:mannose-6-phosphate isomerase
MPQLDTPLLLSPVSKPKIWGRRDLAPLFRHPAEPRIQPSKRPLPSRAAAAVEDLPLIGEVWLTDDTSRFLNGPVAGSTLAEASRQYGPELLGRAWKHCRFPVLAKYLFTSDWLSLQVHPDDDYAARHEPGNSGKCEMWYVVRADPGARFLLGAKPGATLDKLRAAARQGTSRELVHAFRPKPREAIFVPPGTLHALGPGLVLFEAEQNSDLTYRLDDWGRVGVDGKPRPLHLDKGLEVARLDLPALRDLPRVTVREVFGSRRFVVVCRHFAVEELLVRRAASFAGSPERAEGLSILEGQGRVETAAGWLAYRTGQTWLIPPATRQYRLVPENPSRLLKFYVPDIERDFRQPLAKRRLSAAAVKRICFE